MGTQDPAVEEGLDRWVEAKRRRDFVTADAVRAELMETHGQGADPNIHRPKDWPGWQRKGQGKGAGEWYGGEGQWNGQWNGQWSGQWGPEAQQYSAPQGNPEQFGMASPPTEPPSFLPPDARHVKLSGEYGWFVSKKSCDVFIQGMKLAKARGPASDIGGPQQMKRSMDDPSMMYGKGDNSYGMGGKPVNRAVQSTQGECRRPPNFGGFVLGYIESNFCKQIFV